MPRTPASAAEDTSADQDKINFVVIPLIYESSSNTTQLAEKRAAGPGMQ